MACTSSLLVPHGRWGCTGTCFSRCWTKSELLRTRTLPTVWRLIMQQRSAERRKGRRWHISSSPFAHSTGNHCKWISATLKGWGSTYAIMTSHMRQQQAEAGSQQVSEHELSKDNGIRQHSVREHFSCAWWISPAKKTAFCNCDHVEWAVKWVSMVVRLIGRDIAQIAKGYRRNRLTWASSSTYLGLPRRDASRL